MRFVDLVKGIADPAFVIGVDQQLLTANEAAANLVGIPVDRLAGRACSEVIAALHPGGECLCTSADCPVYQSMVNGEPVALGWCHWATPDGRLLPISGTVLSAPRTARPSHEDGVALVIVHINETPTIDPPQFELRLLGTTTLHVRGERVPLPRRRRAIELLAYLALSSSGVTRDQLLEVFWPDIPPEDSAPRLRVVVHSLRQLLAEAGVDGAIERRGACYVLDRRHISIDALDFEARARAILAGSLAATNSGALDQALRLYTGEFGASERFGAWAAPEVERLRRTYHDLLARAVQFFARCGAIERSVEYCETAVRSDPLQEQFQIALIAYYGYLNRREDVVNQYEDYRRTLLTDVGAIPAPAVVHAFNEALQTPSTP